jgi:hypothetical protein
MTATAKEEYAIRRKEAGRLLRQLDSTINRHAKRQQSRDFDWGYVGDIGRMNEILREAIRFMGV